VQRVVKNLGHTLLSKTWATLKSSVDLYASYEPL